MSADVSVEEFSDGHAIFTVSTEGGRLAVLAEVSTDTELNRVTLSGLNIHGEGVWKNGLGASKLRKIVHEIMEQYDVDEIVIEGAVRVTGAGPGRLPRPIRFARKVAPEDIPEPK